LQRPAARRKRRERAQAPNGPPLQAEYPNHVCGPTILWKIPRRTGANCAS
jgi:hypothetical protein